MNPNPFFRMNLDLSSMSEFEMCAWIQELVSIMDDEDIPSKTFTTMDEAMAEHKFEDKSEECFDCPANGKICSKTMEIAGKPVLLIIMPQ